MLHLCNVLNVVRIGLDSYRSGHTREQDCRTVKEACASRMTTTVCNGATTGKSTLSQDFAASCSGTKAERVTKLHKNVYKAKRSTDLSDLSLEPGGLDDVARLQGEKQGFMSSPSRRRCHRYRRFVPQ